MGSFSLVQWIIVGVIVVVLIRGFSRRTNSVAMVCKACGHVGVPESRVRGSLAIEIILWLCLIIPGLIYSIWRMGSRFSACAKCASEDIIPLDSPLGQKLHAEAIKPPQ